jgi:hypothetical protein
MLDFRTLVLGLGAFSATFAVGWWLGIGKGMSLPAAVASALPGGAATSSAPATPPPAVRPAGSQVAARPVEPAQGTGLTDNDGLRRAVIWRAEAYQRPDCRSNAKKLYVIDATKYAEALMRAAGCSRFPKCAMGTEALDRVWRLNRSAADLKVAAAMASVHAAGGLSDADFRGDVGRAVRVIAGAGFASGPPPECRSVSSRRGTWRIRFRR